MFYRKDAVFMAVAGILASAGFAVADNTAVKTPTLTLDPVASTEMAPADAAPSGLLMTGLSKVGVGDSLNKLGLNIYGWIEGGYTYDHRHHKTLTPILPGPFNHEYGGTFGNFSTPTGGDRNHFMLNQFDLRFERLVKNDKWDVGGLIEVQYGTDAAGIHSNGMSFGNETYNGPGGSNVFHTGETTDDRYNPQYQFDVTQAYVDVNVPIGNGLKIRAGKFVTLMGYETIDPRSNPFYSHSYLFGAIPFTQTGVLAFYNINSQWAVAGGISRGWNQSLEDNNGSIDTLGQVIFTPNKQWEAKLSWTVGPENAGDSSHYRFAPDLVISWQATDKLKLGFEALYVYDGGRDADGFAQSGFSHAYGDQWGAALYGQYVFNDYCTFNVRLEKFHDYVHDELDGSALSIVNNNQDTSSSPPSIQPTTNFYSVTVGLTLKPFPKDPIGKNLMIRPEVRYTYCDGPKPFIEGDSLSSAKAFHDQLLFAADVVFGF